MKWTEILYTKHLVLLRGLSLLARELIPWRVSRQVQDVSVLISHTIDLKGSSDDA
ncbi:hypothetical protein [Microseira wollei]|uniref:hypothetical protein n=1 Tax=Microseira wollei TaxID=467598 RepID=UPI001CFF33F4|nr:hypothetical protein [Microseira wollei]